MTKICCINIPKRRTKIPIKNKIIGHGVFKLILYRKDEIVRVPSSKTIIFIKFVYISTANQFSKK